MARLTTINKKTPFGVEGVVDESARVTPIDVEAFTETLGLDDVKGRRGALHRPSSPTYFFVSALVLWDAKDALTTWEENHDAYPMLAAILIA